MTTVYIAAQALTEVGTYRMKAGSFASPLVNKMATDGKTRLGTHFIDPDKCLYKHSCIILNAGFSYELAAEWWAMFGSSTPTLTKLALRLVSQCASSSGCERNWSTFAFIHIKVCNRLSYKKLHKLVHVNYNLRIQNNLDAGVRSTVDDDPFDRLMDLTLNDVDNSIQEWMEAGRSVGVPELDEDDSDSDAPLPSHFVSATVDPSDLLRQIGAPSILDWAVKVAGDTHTGRRKQQKLVARKRSKNRTTTKQ